MVTEKKILEGKKGNTGTSNEVKVLKWLNNNNSIQRNKSQTNLIIGGIFSNVKRDLPPLGSLKRHHMISQLVSS